MTTSLLQLLMMLCWGISAAAMAAYVYSIAREITYVTLPDGRKSERKIPLVFRLLLPFAPNFFRIASLPSFAKTRDAAKKLLIQGGLEGLLSPVEFVSLKFLVPAVFGSAWCVMIFLLNFYANFKVEPKLECDSMEAQSLKSPFTIPESV
jgi:hypothetical protein